MWRNMIREAEKKQKALFLDKVLPSKTALNEFLICAVFGVLFGRVELLESINIFGLSWLVVLFFNKKSVAWGLAGVLLGRLGMLPIEVNAIFGEVGTYFGAYMLMNIVRRTQKENKIWHYLLVTVLFYIVARFALVFSKGITVYDVTMIGVNAAAIVFMSAIFSRAFDAKWGRRKVKGELSTIVTVITASLAVLGIGKLNIAGVVIRNIIIYAAIFLSAYLYGAAAGALTGTIFGILVGITDTFTMSYIVTFSLCGTLCGALNRLNKVLNGLIVLGVYIALFFLLQGTAASITGIIEVFSSLLIFVAFPQDLFFKMKNSFHFLNAGMADMPDYADRMRMMCMDRLGQLEEATQSMRGMLEVRLRQNEDFCKQNLEQVSDKIMDLVCRYCTECSSCGFVLNRDSSVAAECSVAQAVTNINAAAGSWSEKMVRYRNVPSAAIGCIEDAISQVESSLEETVDLDYMLTSMVELEVKRICRNVSTCAVLRTENGLQVLLQLNTRAVDEEMLQTIRKSAEEVVNTKFDVQCNPSAGKVWLNEKPKIMLMTGCGCLPLEPNGICGDASTVVPFGDSGFLLAVADGCGTGYQAMRESSMAIEMLETMAQSGCTVEPAIKFINALMGVKNTDSSYSTADVCIVDKYTASATFVKMGAVASFVIRKGSVLTINGGSSPLGVVENTNAAVSKIQLKQGDVIVMMTDGVFEICCEGITPEDYYAQYLANAVCDNPQRLADDLIKNAAKNSRKSEDDMLVLTALVIGKK